ASAVSRDLRRGASSAACVGVSVKTAIAKTTVAKTTVAKSEVALCVALMTSDRGSASVRFRRARGGWQSTAAPCGPSRRTTHAVRVLGGEPDGAFIRCRLDDKKKPVEDRGRDLKIPEQGLGPAQFFPAVDAR